MALTTDQKNENRIDISAGVAARNTTTLTVADAVTIDATFNATEQTTMINMRTRINESRRRSRISGSSRSEHSSPIDIV